MTIKSKGFVWWFAWPFAHPTSGMFTVVGDTIYCPKGCYPTQDIIKHESIHVAQRKTVGAFAWYVAYLFFLPVLWNPFRRKWETEAYEGAQVLTIQEINKKLRRVGYGWLIWGAR